MSEHRSGINPGFVTRHTLSLYGLDKHNAPLIVHDIGDLPYIDRVKLIEAKQMLTVAYDASAGNVRLIKTLKITPNMSRTAVTKCRIGNR